MARVRATQLPIIPSEPDHQGEFDAQHAYKVAREGARYAAAYEGVDDHDGYDAPTASPSTVPPMVRFVYNCVQKAADKTDDSRTMVVGVEDMMEVFAWAGWPMELKDVGRFGR